MTRCHDEEVSKAADHSRCTHRYHTYQFNDNNTYTLHTLF